MSGYVLILMAIKLYSLKSNKKMWQMCYHWFIYYFRSLVLTLDFDDRYFFKKVKPANNCSTDFLVFDAFNDTWNCCKFCTIRESHFFIWFLLLFIFFNHVRSVAGPTRPTYMFLFSGHIWTFTETVVGPYWQPQPCVLNHNRGLCSCHRVFGGNKWIEGYLSLSLCPATVPIPPSRPIKLPLHHSDDPEPGLDFFLDCLRF